MGKLIVIEGLDGSGKATQSKLLADKMNGQGTDVRLVSFPAYDSASSALVKMYLAGDFGRNPEDVNAYAASTFYTVDRFASWQTGWKDFYNAGGVVIADRYTTSNYIHQGTKLPAQEMQAYVDWLEDLEYAKVGIPKPDVVIYLDVEPDVSQRLLSKRYSQDEGCKDIHEKNVTYLEKCRKAAMWCVQNLEWKKIECSQNGVMLPIDEIEKQVAAIVEEIL